MAQRCAEGERDTQRELREAIEDDCWERRYYFDSESTTPNGLDRIYCIHESTRAKLQDIYDEWGEEHVESYRYFGYRYELSSFLASTRVALKFLQFLYLPVDVPLAYVEKVL